MKSATRTIIIAILAMSVYGCDIVRNATRMPTTPTKSYAEAVRICRFWNGDLIRRRLSVDGITLKPCLNRMGWLPSGQPVNPER